jgi:hypothetical protein
MPVPVTQIRTSHAVSIRAGGQTIGQIQQWGATQSRAVAAIYEINATTTGEIFEQVPSVVSNCTITVARYDLYTAKMEEVWGTPQPFWMLSDQWNPIDVEEKWIRISLGDDKKTSLLPGLQDVPILGHFPKGAPSPTWGEDLGASAANSILKGLGLPNPDSLEGIQIGNAASIKVEKLWYSGCYFSQLGRTLSATGDRIVMVNATLNYKKVRPM